MNNFDARLTALLDGAAATINPRADFEAVRSGHVTIVPHSGSGASGGRPPFRRGLAVAAVTVALLGGSVAAFQVRDDGPAAVATSSDRSVTTPLKPEPTTKDVTTDGVDPASPKPDVPIVSQPPKPSDQPGIEDRVAPVQRTAQLGAADLESEPSIQKLFGTAQPGEHVLVESPYGAADTTAHGGGQWELALTLTGAPRETAIPIHVSFGDSTLVFDFTIQRPAAAPVVTEPKPEPEPEPVVVEFTAALGGSSLTTSPMKQVFYGTAPAGAVVTASSDYGWAQATATSKGKWELVLKMVEVPVGTPVYIAVSSTSSDHVFEFELVRQAPEPPKTVEFTAALGSGDLGGAPMKQRFYGTGQPGSAVRAGSEYGVAEVVVNGEGYWELKLEMFEVPGGTTVGVRVTNNASDAVFEFGLYRPPSEPPVIEFTANAAFVECDSNPPFNEYWGKSTPGALITISSPYGGGQVTANGEGKWAARIEFPSAPVGEYFNVRLTSSKSGAVYDLPFVRVGGA